MSAPNHNQLLMHLLTMSTAYYSDRKGYIDLGEWDLRCLRCIISILGRMKLRLAGLKIWDLFWRATWVYWPWLKQCVLKSTSKLLAKQPNLVTAHLILKFSTPKIILEVISFIDKHFCTCTDNKTSHKKEISFKIKFPKDKTSVFWSIQLVEPETKWKYLR